MWAPLGLEPFERFISSYREHSAGLDHRLVIVLNGFASRADTGAYTAVASDLAPDTLLIGKPVWDIAAYLYAADQFESEYFCYLNSHSVLLAPDWLAKMFHAVKQPRVSLVSATGSYESHYSSQREQFRFSDARPLARRCYRNLRTFAALEKSRARFSPFPAPHLRTNAFLIARETLRRLCVPRLASKSDCYRFESGRNSMTNQLKRNGGECLVVGRDGTAYAERDWSTSATFRRGEQRNLLVADNQTRAYAAADPLTQATIRRLTWGDASDIADGTTGPSPQQSRSS